MADEMCITLGGVRLVCHLVTLSYVANSDVTQLSPPELREKYNLPVGYFAFPDIGMAYRYHEDSVLWSEAKNRCFQEDAQLAVINTAKKLEYIGREMPLRGVTVHAGIIRVDNSWVNANTGLPVSPIRWQWGYPEANHGCTMFYSRNTGVRSVDCGSQYADYVCQIPIPSNSTISAN